jgi:hypothetical protein
MLAGIDDDLSVGAELAFIVAQRGFVEGRYRKVAIDVTETPQSELVQLGAKWARGLLRKRKDGRALLGSMEVKPSAGSGLSLPRGTAHIGRRKARRWRIN